MLTITQLPNKRLSIKADFYYKDRIKKIPTAIFNPDIKQWSIADFMLGTLENEFQGELVYKTPRWVILNQPMPDMSAMYEIHDKTIQTPILKLKPYDYQDYGIRFMIDRILTYNTVLNSDSVGLGKTLSAIGTLKWFIENKNINKVLIICKKTIKKQWADEIKKFTDLDNDYDIVYTGSTASQRHKAYNTFINSNKNVLITNYHSFLNDMNFFKQMSIDFVIIDEVHELRNHLTGKMHKNIKSIIHGLPSVLLTGTPIMSRPEDIYGVIDLVDENYFSNDWRTFQKDFLVIDRNNRFGPRIVGAKNLNILREKVQNLVIRRTEYEVSIQLPKTVINRIDCNMDSTQEKLLAKIQEEQNIINDTLDKLKINNVIPDFNREKAEKLEAKSKAFIAARQAASTDPRMFLKSSSKLMKDTFGNLVPSTYKMSNKSEAILEQVDTILQSDNKVILFSKFKTSAVLIAEDIAKQLKVKTLLYTGDESDIERDKAIDLFKNSDEYNVLVGTEAMSTGLNIQVAKYMINIDQPDTEAIKTQRIGRIRRVGSQYDNVIVYDMITTSTNKAYSKDEERLENIEKNKDLTDALISIDSSQRVALVNAMKGE